MVFAYVVLGLVAFVGLVGGHVLVETLFPRTRRR